MSAWDIGETVSQAPESGASTGAKQFYFNGNPNKQDYTRFLLPGAVALVALALVFKRMK